MNDLKIYQQIIDLLNKKHEESNGSCGINLVDLISILNINYSELKTTLSEMHKEKTIKVRKGINGFLIFKK